MLSTSASIALTTPDAVLEPMLKHLESHKAVISVEANGVRIVLDGAQASLATAGGELRAVVEAPDLPALLAMKRTIAEHLAAYAPDGATAGMRWSGDGLEATHPPDFRVLTVTATETVTPHMRRIHFTGRDLGRFDSLEALHVRLHLPPAGLASPVWPQIGADGLLQAPPPEQRPTVRKYTIRAIDAAAGTLAIDFVLHEDAGPGSAFAARASVGDVVGMTGPGGRGMVSAEHYFFLADETGLPAAARMLANLPAHAKGQAVFEVADAAEEQNLAAPPGIGLRWLHRGAAAPGGSGLLPDAFAALDWPPEAGVYLWVAAEHDAFRTIRAAARDRLRPDKDKQLIVSYWRNGMSEERHVEEKRRAMQAA